MFKQRFAGVPWLIWGIGCLIVAAIWLVVVPNRQQLASLSGLRFVIMRWFHSITWVLLAIAALLAAAKQSQFAKPVAFLGLGCYLLYLAVLIF